MDSEEKENPEIEERAVSMFLVLCDALEKYSAEDISRAQRRNAFAALLFTRPTSELALLLERSPTLIDLELVGAENETEYRDVIKIILRDKTADALRATPKTMTEARLNRAAQMIRTALAGPKTPVYLGSPAREFLADLLAVLDG